ncbi:MAG: AAA family ATPase [Candidatus Omnitrophica bacterium]|nr:AAA family ATPase [Candidatus Omnitrophota bacterium]
MHFKKLELCGFKSFAEKTTLHFEPGITAVVGPNGCGKSNIFDSIRWVLGEQSAKSLRGAEMQDVIFNGTDTKEAVSMSEVTLTFDNENRFFNFDNNEVAITRRLFRSGESEYLLNKNQVRLKDILDLLLGTGIGAESYSIVAQGKIDLVLSSRPEDRRLVFDEASGITKYKAQKRETLRKLEDTEQNLLRVNDIVTEVKRQIGSLERQANKARKYKEVFEELKTKETNLSFLQRSELLKQKEEVANQIKAQEVRSMELLAAISDEEAKISSRQQELKSLEESMMALKNQIMNMENSVVRNNEHIKFNQERAAQLAGTKKYLQEQIEQIKNKLNQDEEKLNKVREEYGGLRKTIDEKTSLLNEKESIINALAQAIKSALDTIAKSKQEIMDLEAQSANTKNQIGDLNSKKQVFAARKKRLEIERAKVFEERSVIEANLEAITREVEGIKKLMDEINLKINVRKVDLDTENSSLGSINEQIVNLERQNMALESHREFLEALKSKYEDIDESMNAVIYLDKLPKDNLGGLVIKIKDSVNLSDEDKAYFDPASIKVSGEAKPIELDTRKIDEKIAKIQEELNSFKAAKAAKESGIEELSRYLSGLQEEMHAQEINFANKETSRATILEQFNKIKEEDDVINLELTDVHQELEALDNNLIAAEKNLSSLNSRLLSTEDRIEQEEDGISNNSKLREEVLVVITQTKTELDSLNKRIVSDEVTLKLLEDTYRHDQESLQNIQNQIKDADAKKESLEAEIKECESKVAEFSGQIEVQKASLKDSEEKYLGISEGMSGALEKIETGKKELSGLKDKLYELQMQDKDVEYKFSTLKDRMLNAYKVDLELPVEVVEGLDPVILAQEIGALKSRLDSYGNVNLVAIEEYDELKKRYDFLVQQQTDLLTAKESLHQAILKINRTTKQMFLETFEKVREEFRNYFRQLFNGGDAQVFLTDESDPLESGIEIICRPPGKKLQNVLLLSGGEKSMSAIALIFAIFKVKPSPFCILDEIDAALDEANVDRFGRMVREFARDSQFIVITHNKRTIANADVMYGITMQQSGISKIVSVKFSQSNQNKEKKETAAEQLDAADAAMAEPV